LAHVERDRKCENIDYNLLKDALETLVALDYDEPEIKFKNYIFCWSGHGSFATYDRCFENPLKKMIQEEFAQKSSSYLSKLNRSTYLLEVENLLKIEEKRGS
jgi:hypothetical protein